MVVESVMPNQAVPDLPSHRAFLPFGCWPNYTPWRQRHISSWVKTIAGSPNVQRCNHKYNTVPDAPSCYHCFAFMSLGCSASNCAKKDVSPNWLCCLWSSDCRSWGRKPGERLWKKIVSLKNKTMGILWVKLIQCIWNSHKDKEWMGGCFILTPCHPGCPG